MAPNLSAICLTAPQMQMHGTDFEKYLQRYLFPCIAIFGILGNALNLTVLLNRGMRTRANIFLATLAIADMVFLSLLLPNVLANYPVFTFNYYFRLFYFHTKVHLLSFANWSSAVAIWCVIAVCADRLMGIRDPLSVRTLSVGSYKMSLLLCAIVMGPGIFTIYQHFAYICRVRYYCNGTQLYSRCMAVNQDGWFANQTNPYSDSFKQFIDVSIFLNVVLIIIFPIILLTALNMLLLCTLRQRSSHLLIRGEEISRPCVDSMKHHKTEQRVTLTVALIVTMFTITNGPSAIVHLLQTVYESTNTDKQLWYNITLLCSTLVICGKASNFILFCLSSQHFRQRLFSIAKKKVHQKMDRISSRRHSSNGRISVISARKPTPSYRYISHKPSEQSLCLEPLTKIEEDTGTPGDHNSF